MALKTFKRGTVAPERKEATRNQAIQKSSVPEKVYLPLAEGPGEPAKPVVKKGDEVKAGQLLAEAQGNWGLPVRASISGTVEGIVERALVSGQSGKAIVIAAAGEESSPALEPLGEKIEDLDPAAIITRVQEAGILGMGGAAFPAHIKLAPPEGVTIDTVIINGAECEPYLTCDEKIMEEKPEEIVKGLQILMQATGAKEGIIGVKGHKKKALEGLEKAAEGLPAIRTCALADKYPQGAEKMLIDAILRRRVPKGGLPFQVGVVVNNVQTAVAVKEAVLDGQSLLKRVVTVTGSGVNEPKDIEVYVGTLAAEVVEMAGGLKEEAGKVVHGGPLMGISQHNLDFPLGKSTAGLLILSEEEAHLPREWECIRCARCVDNCPMFLNPISLANFSQFDRLEDMERFSIMECIECGTCSYICPAKKPLVQRIILGKGALRAAQRKNAGRD